MAVLTDQQRQIGRDNYADAVRISRRQMLTGAVALPVAASGAYFGYDKISDEPVRVGVIGTGDQGNAHISQMNPDYCRVVAFSDIRESNIKRTMENLSLKFGSPPDTFKHYYDYQELLANPDVEMVIIALPLWLHAPATIAAIKAGKDVLCEKLMAHNVLECKQMIRAADQSKRLLAIGHQRHYSYLYANCRSVIEQGDVLGDIRHIRAYWHRNQAGWGAPEGETGKYDSWFKAVPDEDKKVDLQKYGYTSYEELVRWRVFNRTGAGLVAELGSHQLDACSIFLGKVHPKSVHGTGLVSFFQDNREVEDHVFLLFEYPKDSPAKGAVVMYSSIGTNAFDGYGEQVMGTCGTLIVQEEANAYLFKDVPGVAKDTRVNWAEERISRPVVQSGSTRAWGGTGETPDTLTSRGYREEQEHMAWLIRNRGKIAWASQENPHPENDPATAAFTPRCHGRVGLADAVIALVSNICMKTGTKIEFQEEWFDPYSDATPETEYKIA